MARVYNFSAGPSTLPLSVLEKAGAFIKYNGETLGQGREAVKKLFREKPELMAEIEDKVRAKAANA